MGDAANLGWIALYAGLAALAVYGVRARSRKILLCGALGYVPFLPAAHVLLPVGTLLGERLLYLPSVGVCVGLGGLVQSVLVDDLRQKGERESPGRGWRRVAACLVPTRRTVAAAQRAAVAAVLLGAAGRTSLRNGAWRDERALFEASLDVCPRSLKVLNNLALVLLNAETLEDQAHRDLPRARSLLDAALETHHAFPSALFNRGLVHHLEDRRMAAIQDFSDGLKSGDQGERRVHTYLGQEFWLLMRTLDRTVAPGADVDGLKVGLLQLAEQSLLQGDPNMPLTNWARASVAFELNDAATTEKHAALALAQSQAVRQSGKDLSSAIREAPAYNLLGLARRALGPTSPWPSMLLCPRRR